MFLKKLHSPNERVPMNKLLKSQANYEVACEQGIPEGIVLPSPGDKIQELRLRIEATDDPEEKAKLEALLKELTESEKEIEFFEYDLEGDWGPEHHADVAEGDMHSYHLKPCKSNLGEEVDASDLHTIVQKCGPGVMGTSMKV